MRHTRVYARSEVPTEDLRGHLANAGWNGVTYQLIQTTASMSIRGFPLVARFVIVTVCVPDA